MKKALRILLPLGIAAVVIALVVVFWEPIVDFLPIDQSGWEELDGKTCYLDPDGDPVTGWQEIQGQHYYFAPDGQMTTGWTEVDGTRYYFNDDGTLHTGWLSTPEGSYYLLSDGSPADGWQEIDGHRHYFTSQGTPVSGWLEDAAGKLYLLEDGSIATGWQEIDGKRYLFQADGSPFSGWLTTSDGTVYLTDEGSVATGWVVTEDGRYCFDETGAPCTGWQEGDGTRFFLDSTGKAQTGWQELDGQRYYTTEQGLYTGWLEEDGQRYYFDENGAAHLGWLEDGGYKYYLTETGVVRGKYVIDEVTYYFTSTGANIILVNPWNSLPEGFSVELVETTGGRVTAECKVALEQMLADCRAAGYSPQIVSSYRSIADQRANLNNMVTSWQAKGYSYSQAYHYATQIVAVPGTSEHHLGLALDIVDSAYPKLNHQQATRPTQQWLMENCWKYGFIMRYPENTTDITGIIYEPWHYRYVGLELAKEIYEMGVCLEVYLDRLTNDGTTCGGKLVTE